MRIAVVGPCASGKSTLVSRLTARGVDAYAVGQEHSDVPDLWARRAPDRLVLLDLSLNTLRARRSNPFWPRWVYERQLVRLIDARAHADLIVDTDRLDQVEVAELVTKRLFP
jgi:adenylate kinase family enzyme